MAFNHILAFYLHTMGGGIFKNTSCVFYTLSIQTAVPVQARSAITEIHMVNY